MKKYILAASMVLCGTAAMAQETYESAQLATEDLNGTARYIGMGGAMEALGADISTINSNPASIGLYRHSWFGTSFGMSFIPEQSNIANSGKTATSFDQIGFVWSTRTSNKSFLNFAFNYHKSRNFNQILPVIGALNGGAMNKSSYIKGIRGSVANGGFCPDFNDKDEYIGWENDASNYAANTFTQTDYVLWNAFLSDTDDNWGYNDASGFDFKRNNKGYIGEYDINISGNSKDRIYWGLTLGLKDVHYDASSTYNEYLLNSHDNPVGNLSLIDSRLITGYGYNISGGIIFRPVEYSPFRIGLSISTPTFYELTSSNYTTLYNKANDNGMPIGYSDKWDSQESYTYRMNTPWKFGVSAGHTVGNVLAIGATYEFSDYSSVDNRSITGEYYDYLWDSYTSESESEPYMNSHTSQSLKGVHNFKIGAEYVLTDDFSVRMGYNYTSPMYEKNAVRDLTINAPGVYYASTTDYTNWEATHRFTLGLGYNIDDFSIDLAYMNQSQNGVFHPYQAMEQIKDIDNTMVSSPGAGYKVKNERNQFTLTLGYHF